jgi:tetratricopeptide (TPR) repeat protein
MIAAGRDALVEAAFRTGDFGAAGATLEAARQAAEAQGNMPVLAAALDQLGFLQHWKNLEWRMGGAPADAVPPQDVAAELALFEQALALRRALGDEAGVAESLFHIGLVHQLFKNDWDTALSYFQRAHSLAEVAGDDLLLSETHRHIGAFFWVRRGDLATALAHLEQSVALRERLAFPGWLASGLITLGQCELQAGQIAAARYHLRRGLQLAEAAGLRLWWIQQARGAVRQAEAAAK